MKSIFVAAIIAAACSGVALAGELKQDQKTAAPVIKGTVMNDAEMDKVAAGSGVGFGVNTAANHTNAVSNAETVVGNLRWSPGSLQWSRLRQVHGRTTTLLARGLALEETGKRGRQVRGIHSRGLPMKSIFIAAIIAAACSSVALAGDAKQDQKAAAPAVKAQVMTDSEMDKVTAGSAHPNPGIGTETASGVANGHATVPFQGFGVCQTDASGRCNIPSDIRLKRDIVQVSRLDSGLGLYRYRYKWSDQVYVGVMAQEVALIRPDAVIRGADGYLRVDYSRLGLHLMTWDEWAASGGENGLKQTKAMSDSEMDKVTAGSAARAETFYLSENPYTVFNSGSKGYAINSNPNYNAVINGFNGK